MINGIEIRHLRYFLLLAEELHFGRAAERLHMAQAPFSQQIKQLEERIGTPLFHRTTRKVQMSEAGRRFQSYAQQVLSDLDEGVRFARATASDEAGQIRVGLISVGTSTVLPIAMRKFRDIHPAVLLSPFSETTGVQLRMLLENELEVGLMRPARLPSYLRGEVIYREGMCVAMSSDHPLATRESLTAEDLVGQPLMRFIAKIGTGFEPTINKYLADVGVQPEQGPEYTSTAAGLCLVAGGMGLAIMPYSAAVNAYPGISYLPIDLGGILAEVSMVTRAGPMDRKLKDLCDVIRGICAPGGEMDPHRRIL
ncbi:LysR family transcriptional regulator [Flavimaricola marinus]|uniref:HTH-type transcriptional regulator BenM n=1 Tax=Flavimaricola marinus TaxID=1819565 RepID=A0A238LKQ3_9RHOB|nr:LysR substrate-binding domain-containing protein [Flavimaricola marinus]SMY09450.1 HTH-type transcriptional regulator BenM [Flavimaricola marinus]